MSEEKVPEHYKVLQDAPEWSFFERLDRLIAEGWVPLGPYIREDSGFGGYLYSIHLWRQHANTLPTSLSTEC